LAASIDLYYALAVDDVAMDPLGFSNFRCLGFPFHSNHISAFDFPEIEGVLILVASSPVLLAILGSGMFIVACSQSHVAG
jgi:hypothetical protein